MSESKAILTQTRASCPSCGRICEPGATWPGANFCRGLVLLPFIKAHPGSSAWELAQASGLNYNVSRRGLEKLREFEAVSTESEDRGDGSFRYRYSPAHDAAALEQFLATLRRVEERA